MVKTTGPHLQVYTSMCVWTCVSPQSVSSPYNTWTSFVLSVATGMTYGHTPVNINDSADWKNQQKENFSWLSPDHVLDHVLVVFKSLVRMKSITAVLKK